MECKVTILPHNETITVEQGTVLLDALKKGGYWERFRCGGNGTCGQCILTVNGAAVKTCRYWVKSDITVEIHGERKV